MPIIRYDIGDMAYFIPNNNDDKLNTICYIKEEIPLILISEIKSNNLIKISEYPFWSIHVHGLRIIRLYNLITVKLRYC